MSPRGVQQWVKQTGILKRIFSVHWHNSRAALTMLVSRSDLFAEVEIGRAEFCWQVFVFESRSLCEI